MARRVFFSFHYQHDIWKVNIVRNSHIVEGSAAAGFQDASIWEAAKTQGDAAVHRLIDRGLDNTSVTCVLIGAFTAQRKYVEYEIEQSVKRRNGLLGVHLYNIQGINTGLSGIFDSLPGDVPAALARYNAPIYTWDREKFGDWVEAAYQKSQSDQIGHSLTDALSGFMFPAEPPKKNSPTAWETLNDFAKWPWEK